jgi:hypothetical protein
MNFVALMVNINIRTEVELRFSGNKTFLRNTEGGTINDVCMQYLTGPMGEYYGQPKPATSKHATSAPARAQPVLSLELFINKVAVSLVELACVWLAKLASAKSRSRDLPCKLHICF